MGDLPRGLKGSEKFCSLDKGAHTDAHEHTTLHHHQGHENVRIHFKKWKEQRCDDVIVCGCVRPSPDIDRTKPSVLHFMMKCTIIGYIIEHILMLLTKKKDSKGGHGIVKRKKRILLTDIATSGNEHFAHIRVKS